MKFLKVAALLLLFVVLPVSAANSDILVMSYSTDTGYAPLQIQFFATCPDCTNVEWDFGDGSPIVSGTTQVHTYMNPGLYTVILAGFEPDGITKYRHAQMSVLCVVCNSKHK